MKCLSLFDQCACVRELAPFLITDSIPILWKILKYIYEAPGEILLLLDPLLNLLNSFHCTPIPPPFLSPSLSQGPLAISVDYLSLFYIQLCKLTSCCGLCPLSVLLYQYRFISLVWCMGPWASLPTQPRYVVFRRVYPEMESQKEMKLFANLETF